MKPLTIEEVAAKLGGSMPIHTAQVHAMQRAGLLKAFGRGANMRILEESVDQFIADVAVGNIQWPPRATQKLVAPANRIRKASSKQAPPTTGKYFGDVPLVAKPSKLRKGK